MVTTKTSFFPQWPNFEADEVAAAGSVLNSGKVNYWTGSEGKQFEAEFAQTINRKYAIAVANGTLALELALYALGIGQGDEVIVPCRTFIATASCVVARGAMPVVADVDCQSQNITLDAIKAVMTSRTKAIIVVHLAGWPCDMDPILQFAKENHLWVIEDCAQAIGAQYNNRPVGSLGDVAAFSFCQDKIITTAGEGGMLVLDDKNLWEKAWSYRDHGKNYELVHQNFINTGFRWLHTSFGTNWRLTEVQSTIGRIQLRKLAGWIEQRRKNAAILTECFKKIPALRVTIPPSHCYHSYYKYYVFLRPECLSSDWNQNKIIEAINAEGIPCFSGSCPEIQKEQAFAKLSYSQLSHEITVGKQLGETSLMFLVHPTCQKSDLENTCKAVEKVLYQASGSQPVT